MTAIADFDIANDLKVEFFLPRGDDIFIIGISKLGSEDLLDTTGAFVIGESLLGGSDILGGSGFEWRDLACEAAQIEMSIGGQVQNEIYFQPQPAQANIILQSYEYDPSVNSAFRPGTKCRIRLEKGAFSEVIFQGKIDTIGGTYVVDGKNRLDVVAYDNYKEIANTRIPLFDTDTDFPEGFVTPYEQLEVIAEQVGTAMHSSSTDPGGEIPSAIETDIIPSRRLLEAIQVGLGLFWLDPVTEEFTFVPRPDPSIIPDFPVGGKYFTLGNSLLGGIDVLGSGEPVYTIGNDHGALYHLCMSDIKTKADGDVVFNSLKVSLESDDTQSVLIENSDSIELYGKFAIDVPLNTTDVDELERWARAVFNQSPTNLVESVETPAIDRTNNLTQAAFFKPGSLIGVKYDQGVLAISDYYTMTRVSHYIDPDNWLTTLELWKES
jgi:hypothetical protein